MLINESVELHRLAVEPSLGAAVGATPGEVAALEQRLGCQLPLAYREFLLWMGADRDGLFRGTECFIDSVEQNQQSFMELLEENEQTALGYKPVVFFMHHGYIACWFSMGGQNDDPLVYSFNEGDSHRGIKELGRFSEWLLAELVGLARASKGPQGTH
jgi:hypothetical protein